MEKWLTPHIHSVRSSHSFLLWHCVGWESVRLPVQSRSDNAGHHFLEVLYPQGGPTQAVGCALLPLGWLGDTAGHPHACWILVFSSASPPAYLNIAGIFVFLKFPTHPSMTSKVRFSYHRSSSFSSLRMTLIWRGKHLAFCRTIFFSIFMIRS